MAEIAIVASFTFFIASSTSRCVSWALGPCGLTMAFLLWLTLDPKTCNEGLNLPSGFF